MNRWIIDFSMFGIRYEEMVPKGTIRNFLKDKRNENKQFHVYSIVAYVPLGQKLN